MPALRWRAAAQPDEIISQSAARLCPNRSWRVKNPYHRAQGSDDGVRLSGNRRGTGNVHLRAPRASTASAPVPTERGSTVAQSTTATYRFPMTHGCSLLTSIKALPTGECQVDLVVSQLESEYPCMLHWCALLTLTRHHQSAL